MRLQTKEGGVSQLYLLMTIRIFYTLFLNLCSHPLNVYVVTCLHPLAPYPLRSLGPRSFPFIVCVLFVTLCTCT